MEVVRLRGEGLSVRAIAAEVFGEARYRGRVERILAGRGDRVVVTGEVDARGLDGLEPVAAIRMLFERRLAVLVSGEVAPSMNEVQRLLEVSRRLDALAQLERMNELTRNDTETPWRPTLTPDLGVAK